MNKPKVIKDYEKLSPELLEQIKLVYPQGFRQHLVQFTGLDGLPRKGLPFETEDKYYLIRMTEERAIYIIAEDDDYDDNGRLKVGVKQELEGKYEDESFLEDFNSNDDNDLGDLDDFPAGDENLEDLIDI